MEMNRNLYLVCLVVVIIGGINWLVTGIRSMMADNERVDDLLEYTMLPQLGSNIIYFLVFLCTLVVAYPAFEQMM